VLLLICTGHQYCGRLAAAARGIMRRSHAASSTFLPVKSRSISALHRGDRRIDGARVT
jgi:hypothetical protein